MSENKVGVVLGKKQEEKVENVKKSEVPDNNLTISTKLSTEQLICKTPQESPNSSIKSVKTEVVQKKTVNKLQDLYNSLLYLGISQILFGLLMAVFGALVLVHEARLANFSGGLWGGGLAIASGFTGVLASAKKGCPLKRSAQKLLTPCFLALSLICVAVSQLVLVFAATGLARDINCAYEFKEEDELSEGTKRSCPPIDLTRPFNNDTVAWQDSDRFQFTNQIAIEEPNGDWFAINDYKASEHAGTHIDAPYLFVKNGWKVGDIPLSHLVAKGIKIDLSQEADYNVALLPRHLIAWENKYGRIPNNCIILVYFDWGKYYYNRIAYFGGTRPSDYKFPGVSKEAAEWIVTHRKIVGIGIDTPSIDPGKITNFLTHKIFLNNSIYNLENVNIPKSLPADQFMLIVMPMYIEKGTGAPVRIVAFLKRCWLDL